MQNRPKSLCMGEGSVVPRENDVRRILGPHKQQIAKILLEAWDDWKKSSEFSRLRFARTRANIVYDRAVDRALEAFHDNKEIQAVLRQGSAKFVVSEKVIFRYKKGDERGFSTPNENQLSLAYHDHEVMGLYGPMNEQRVEVIYTLNRLQTEVRKIRVIARDKECKLWEWDITPSAEVVSATDKLPVRPTASPESLVSVKDEKKIHAPGVAEEGKRGS